MYKDIFVLDALNESGAVIWKLESAFPELLLVIAINQRKQYPRENSQVTFKMHSYRVANHNHKCL